MGLNLQHADTVVIDSCTVSGNSVYGGGAAGGSVAGSGGAGAQAGGGVGLCVGGFGLFGGSTSTGGGNGFTSEGASFYEVQTSLAGNGDGNLVAVWLAFAPSDDGRVRLASRSFDGQVDFAVDDVPVVTLDDPPDTNVSTPLVTLSGTVADPHLDQVSVNGVTAVVTGAGFTATDVALVEGSNLLEAVATDTFGHSATSNQIEIALEDADLVLFLIDATGSMADEIAQLKDNIQAIAAAIDAHLERGPRREPGHHELVSPAGRFRLHYVTEGVDAVAPADVDPANGVPDLVEIAADALDRAWETLKDAASIDSGIIPKDLLSDQEVLKALPMFFRTVRSEKPTAEELEKLIERIRKGR